MSLVNVCIPTFGNYQILNQCLRSFGTSSPDFCHITIINNESTVESANQIDRIVYNSGMGDRIEVIQPGLNMKWMGAINIGLHKTSSDSEFFCMMNDDVIFPPGSNNFWPNMMRHFEAPSVGAVGPSSNFVAGNQSIHMVSLPDTIETSCLIGFCMMSKTKILKSLGGLDEVLPGGDDIDLSIRLMKNGYKLIAERGSYLHHIGQQTGNRVFAGYWDSEIHQERTMNSMIKKHGLATWFDCWSHQWQSYAFKETENEKDSIHIQ